MGADIIALIACGVLLLGFVIFTLVERFSRNDYGH